MTETREKLLTSAQKEVLSELAHDPPPEERWQNFDPPFRRETLVPLARRGLIEWRKSPDGARFDEVRFTSAGRAALKET